MGSSQLKKEKFVFCYWQFICIYNGIQQTLSVYVIYYIWSFFYQHVRYHSMGILLQTGTRWRGLGGCEFSHVAERCCFYASNRSWFFCGNMYLRIIWAYGSRQGRVDAGVGGWIRSSFWSKASLLILSNWYKIWSVVMGYVWLLQDHRFLNTLKLLTRINFWPNVNKYCTCQKNGYVYNFL